MRETAVIRSVQGNRRTHGDGVILLHGPTELINDETNFLKIKKEKKVFASGGVGHSR